ncbi:MAG: hypothetical protein GY927_11125 [bacterium]|nr:hypothetical protein [bacterium]
MKTRLIQICPLFAARKTSPRNRKMTSLVGQLVQLALETGLQTPSYSGVERGSPFSARRIGDWFYKY